MSDLTIIPVTANRGKWYAITVSRGEAIKVSSVVSIRNSLGATTYSKTLWQQGDEKIGLTAHCALNAWRRQAKENKDE